MHTCCNRSEAHRRQQQFLSELSSLNHEMESYRAEATQSGSNLHTAVDRLQSRIQSEEAQVERHRQDAAVAAGSEAAQMGAIRGGMEGLQAGINVSELCKLPETLPLALDTLEMNKINATSIVGHLQASHCKQFSFPCIPLSFCWAM